MKKILIYAIAAIVAIGTVGIAHAQDYDRNVTVETEFQPIIQDAGKINKKPVIQSTTVPPVPLNYSQFTNEVNPSFTPSKLLSQPTQFEQPDTLNGLLRGAFGHINSEFRFAYTKEDNKKNSLRLLLDHRGAWGTKTLANSLVNIDFSHGFYNGGKFYLNLFGKNQFFTRYGCYFDPATQGLSVSRFAQMGDSTHQVVWWGGVKFGFQSDPREDLTYDVNVAYDMVNMPTLATEHHVKAKLNIQWTNNEHHVGGKVHLQGNFYQMKPQYDSLSHNNRYNIRVEPFYEYHGSRFFFHGGVNIDLNCGKGTQFSSVKRLAFAPSPNIRFEAQLAPKWVILYGQAVGRFAAGNSEEFIAGNRFRDFVCSISSTHTSGYTPIEGELGFRFRPEQNLLLEVHGGYGMQWNKTAAIFVPSSCYLDYVYLNYNSGKVGAAISYHYQDIVTVHAWGDYLFTHNQKVEKQSSLYKLDVSQVKEGIAYDCPSWKIGVDIDARIDKHWSLYSHNRFQGGEVALAQENGAIEGKKLAPWIEINLGCQYEFNNRLALYLDLNNLINRKNDIYYGIQTTGINFLVGVNWRF